MKKRLWIFLLASLLGIPSFAQQANKVATFARNTLTDRSKAIIAATIEMPADKFSFKPAPEDMTFAQLTLHVADGNYLYCSKIGGVAEPTRPDLTDSEDRDKLVQRLQASFDFCTGTFVKLDDSAMSEMLTFGPTKTPRSMAILTLTGTWTDHFAMQTKYLQANGLAPPVSRQP